jgi:diguanylate cyclase (GGDEF)-like protein/PAS domain S-box-containing protein
MKKHELKNMLRMPLCQLIIAVAIVALCALWTAAHFRVQYDYKAEMDTMMHMNETLAAGLAEHVQVQFDQIDETLVFIKLQYEKHGGVNEAIFDRLQSSAALPAMNLSVIDSQGNFLASILAGADKINVADREFFARHKAKDTTMLYISKPIINRFTGRTTFHLTRRLNQPDGSFGGVVVCGVEPQCFSALYRELKLAQSYAITITGLDGVVRLRQSANGMEAGQDMSASPNFQAMTPMHAGSFVATSRFDNERRLLSYHQLARYPMILQVSVRESEALAGFQERQSRYYIGIVILSGLVVLAFGLMLWMISNKEQVAAAQHESEKRFVGAFDRAPVGMVLASPDNRILRVNDCICHLFGYEPHEVLGRYTQEMSAPEDAEINAELREQMLAGEIDTYCIEKRYRHKSGKLLVCLLTTTLVQDKEGTPLYFISQVEDITDKKQAEYKASVEKERLESVLRISQARFSSASDLNDLMLEAVVELSNSEFGFIYFYNEAEQVYSLHAWSQMVMQSCLITDKQTQYRLDTTGFWGEAVRQRRPIVDNDMLAAGPLKKGYPAGHVAIKRFMSVPVFIDGEIVSVVGVANKIEEYTQTDVEQLSLMADSLWNIIERRRAEDELIRAKEELDYKVLERTKELDSAYEKLKEQNEELEALNDELHRLTMTDGLTRVKNRRGFDECIERAWSGAMRQQEPLSLLMIDIDYFKQFNDTYGHQRGDDCLIAVAEVLQKSTRRATDAVARYGGEEFAVLLPDTQLTGALVVAETIREQVGLIRQELHAAENPLITVSIGIATVTPSATALPKTLITLADNALYDAKTAGRNRICSEQNQKQR